MNIRNSSRVLLLDSNNNILLFKFRFTSIEDNINSSVNEFWITPGGGVLSGESFEQALKRELLEETGLILIDKPQWIWTREVIFKKNGIDFLSHERYFLVYKDKCEIGDVDLTDNEKLNLLDRKWWSITEIRDSKEDFRPICISDELEKILLDGAIKDVKTIP